MIDDAKTGNSTVFFAVDPSNTNRIDTWTGGTGGDTFNVFFFVPDQTLDTWMSLPTAAPICTRFTSAIPPSSFTPTLPET